MTETMLALENTPFIDEIRTDLNEYSKGRFMIITGPPGEAKSMVALRIAEKVDDDFNIEKIVIGKNTEFIRILKQAIDGKMHSGEVIVFDEAGVGLGARDWQSAQNRVLSLIFQTIRKLGIMIIITVPTLRMIDIHSRILAKNYGNAKRIDREKNRSIFSFYNLNYDDWEEILKRYKIKDAQGNKIDMWQMALPTTINLDEYENHKNEMLGWLFNRAESVFEQMEKEVEGGKVPRGCIRKEDVVRAALQTGITDTKELGLLTNVKVRQADIMKQAILSVK